MLPIVLALLSAPPAAAPAPPLCVAPADPAKLAVARKVVTALHVAEEIRFTARLGEAVANRFEKPSPSDPSAIPGEALLLSTLPVQLEDRAKSYARHLTLLELEPVLEFYTSAAGQSLVRAGMSVTCDMLLSQDRAATKAVAYWLAGDSTGKSLMSESLASLCPTP